MVLSRTVAHTTGFKAGVIIAFCVILLGISIAIMATSENSKNIDKTLLILSCVYIVSAIVLVVFLKFSKYDRTEMIHEMYRDACMY